MAPDSKIQELNATLAGLVRELDAGTIALVNAFAEFLNNAYPSTASTKARRAPCHATNALMRESLSALKTDIRTAAMDSFAIARRAIGDSIGSWQAHPDAPPAGAHRALRRVLAILEEKLHQVARFERGEPPDERGGAVHGDEAILWSEELDARWREYQDLLRRTGECLEAIDALVCDRLVREALGPWGSS
jgi:hypothetical protein